MSDPTADELRQEGWIVHDERTQITAGTRMHLPELADECVQCLRAQLDEAAQLLRLMMKYRNDRPARRYDSLADVVDEFLASRGTHSEASG